MTAVQVQWLDVVRREAIGESFKANKRDARGIGPPPKGALGCPGVWPGWPVCSGKTPVAELPAARVQGLVAWIRQRTNRPHQQPAGEAGCWWVGWTSVATRDTKLIGRGNDSANGQRASQRQALGGSEGLSLSFMR